MARLILRALQRSANRLPSIAESAGLRPQFRLCTPCVQPRTLAPSSTHRSYGSQAAKSPPVESNVRQIIQMEIDEYQSASAPSSQPAARFGNYEVIDKPGNQVVTLRGRFGESEEIEIKVSKLFSGFTFTKKSGEDHTEPTPQMDLSVSILIKKGEGSNLFKIICMGQPNDLEIKKFAVLPGGEQKSTIYMEPVFQSMDTHLVIKLYEYLEERGINDELVAFLHKYMKNKDRDEFLKWLKKVQLFVE